LGSRETLPIFERFWDILKLQQFARQLSEMRPCLSREKTRVGD